MDAVFETFKVRAEAVNAEVHRFPQKDEALAFIVKFLNDAGVRDAPEAYAVWAACPFLDGFDRRQISTQVPGLTFDVNREVSAQAKVGISQLDWAIANTGTLMQDAAPVDRRLVSTLPLIHIALVRSDRIVPDLPAALTKIRPTHTNYISFITGPSRTADIERVLTIGVHGPEKLVIVFYDSSADVPESVH
ncbi:MAG: lactate utilization protein [Candidatus Sulfotelmatobacter sp.]|jgi:L-lactate dehydrogenase complex protein LldG